MLVAGCAVTFVLRVSGPAPLAPAAPDANASQRTMTRAIAKPYPSPQKAQNKAKRPFFHRLRQDLSVASPGAAGKIVETRGSHPFGHRRIRLLAGGRRAGLRVARRGAAPANQLEIHP